MEAGEKETAYIPIRVLGRGAFGEAMLYRKVADNTLVVWKEVMLGKLSEKERKDAQNEIDILSMLNHANIVSYYNHFLDGDTLLIEMEFCNDGSLCEKLAVMKDLLPENEILWYLYQLVSAVAHIHEYSIIHRDIKTMNIFLTKTGLIKLGDFGISRMMSSQTHMAQTYVGTLLYMSPELVKGDPYDYKTDIWAIGCVLYEMMTLTRVFDATNALRLANDIVHGSFDDISPKYSVEIRNLCNILLNKEPSKRPEAEEILKVPLLDNCANEFDGRIWDLNTSARNLKMSASAATQAQVEVMPVITSQSSEVYFWGGGKLTPQKQELFFRGRSALDIAVGGVHFAVVTVEKELYTWAGPVGFGSGIVGQLGHGDTAAYKAPKKVEALESVSIKQVSCGDDFTVCVSDSGSVYSFGSDYYGCLGCDNQEGDEVCTPVLIDFFTSKPVDQISCGDAHVVALTKDGEVYTWGCGEYGRLGLGSEEDFAVPQKVQTRGRHSIRSVHAGSDNTFVVKTNGRVLACGSNEHNKLGCNSAAQGLYKRKEQISYDIQCRYNLSTVKPLIKYNIHTVSPGPTHTGAIDSGGHLIMFGSNKYGQLGVGDYKERSGVTLVSGVLGGQKVTKVSCGDGFTVIATADNFIYSWGLSENGRLGTDTADQGKGPDSQCFALPRPIFGALHRVSAINSFRWSTGVIAEKVLSQKTIRSTSSGARVYNNMCSEESHSSLGDSVFNGSPRVVEEEQAADVNLEESAKMPWLELELEGEYIAAENPIPPEVQPTPGVEESVPPPWLRKELDEAEIIPISPDNSDTGKLSANSSSQDTFTNSTNSATQNNTQDTEVVRLSALVSRLEFEVTSLREENQGLKARNKELSNKVEDMSRGQQKLQSQIEDQAETIMSQAQTIKQFEEKLHCLEQVGAEIWQAVDAWTEECASLKNQTNDTITTQPAQYKRSQSLPDIDSWTEDCMDMQQTTPCTGVQKESRLSGYQSTKSKSLDETETNSHNMRHTEHRQNHVQGNRRQVLHGNSRANHVQNNNSYVVQTDPDINNIQISENHGMAETQFGRTSRNKSYIKARDTEVDHIQGSNNCEADHRFGHTQTSENDIVPQHLQSHHFHNSKILPLEDPEAMDYGNRVVSRNKPVGQSGISKIESSISKTMPAHKRHSIPNHNNDAVSSQYKDRYNAKFSHPKPMLLQRNGAFRLVQSKTSGKVERSNNRRNSHTLPRSRDNVTGGTKHEPSSLERYSISVKDVKRQGNAIDVLFEPGEHGSDASLRGRINSADNAYSKTALTLLKRTRSVPEQMNLQLELHDQGPTKVVEKLTVIKSPKVQKKWKTLKCDMLEKSYTPSTIKKTLFDFTTNEQII